MRALRNKYLLTVILVLVRFGLSSFASPEIYLNTPADTLIKYQAASAYARLRISQ